VDRRRRGENVTVWLRPLSDHTRKDAVAIPEEDFSLLMSNACEDVRERPTIDLEMPFTSLIDTACLLYERCKFTWKVRVFDSLGGGAEKIDLERERRKVAFPLIVLLPWYPDDLHEVVVMVLDRVLFCFGFTIDSVEPSQCGMGH
jgi:hypothetical protein